MKKWLQKVFKLRTDVGLNFYAGAWFARYLLFQNRDVPWMVHYSSTVHGAEKIVRGRHVYPGDSPGNFIDATNGIHIGDYTNIGPNVGIISANHNLINNEIYDFAPPIRIGAFCWIGMNAVILPGVALGDFCIVGAGAVVTKSFPDGYCVVAGNPARIIKHLDRTACDQYRQTKYRQP